MENDDVNVFFFLTRIYVKVARDDVGVCVYAYWVHGPVVRSLEYCHLHQPFSFLLQPFAFASVSLFLLISLLLTLLSVNLVFAAAYCEIMHKSVCAVSLLSVHECANTACVFASVFT